MKDQTIKIKNWWTELAVREKQGVIGGTILLSIFVSYQCILTPLNNKVSDLREQITVDQETLTWIRAADKEIRKIESATKGKVKNLSPVILLSIMQKQAKHVGLDQYMTQLKQNHNEAIAAHFDKIPFDKLASFLLTLLQENPIKLSQFTIVAENEPGLVNADVIFSI